MNGFPAQKAAAHLRSPVGGNHPSPHEPAAQFLDDTSVLAVSAASVSWNVVSGPVSGIRGAGFATASTVDQNTAATVQGAFGGMLAYESSS